MYTEDVPRTTILYLECPREGMDWQALRGALTSYTILLSGLETSYFSSGSELPVPSLPGLGQSGLWAGVRFLLRGCNLTHLTLGLDRGRRDQTVGSLALS